MFGLTPSCDGNGKLVSWHTKKTARDRVRGMRLRWFREGGMRRLQKTIEEIGWTRAVPRFVARDPVARAFEAMSREAHDCVLIVEGHVLVGIFTSRDFLNR